MVVGRSQSTPGLTGLGSTLPKDRTHHRKSTLTFRLDGPVDLQPRKAPSEKAIQIASQMVGHSWRFASTDPAKRKTMSADNISGAPANCKVPRNSPPWLKHDKQVLRFYAFFQEHVTESNLENSRYRHCVIMYFMEDGTLMITEPKIENSGIPQGAFLKRHRVPTADGMDILGPNDFRCGEDITIYARTYHIVGCDRFTRWFFEDNGIDVGEDEPMAQDLWELSQERAKTAEKAPLSRSAVEAKLLNEYTLGIPPVDRKTAQFLANDRKVLRFKAYWDDPTLYGARFYFVCHFYLADNTFEMNEAHCRNSGRDNYPVFYRRSKLLKESRVSGYPGALEPDPELYMPEDFVVGGTITVWRRTVVLYDCDEFTRKFYLDYMGIDQAEGKLDVSEPPVKHKALPPPPHIGPGTEEDSLINCVMIQPKPPRKDLVRLMTLSGEILRFEAKMDTGLPDDEARRFIIGFYPADDNISVWEVQQRNSGFTGGKFSEKGRRKNPDTGKYFVLSDFAVGKRVLIKSHPLIVVRADEHTLKYAEANVEIFPYAHPTWVARRLAPLSAEEEFRSPGGVEPDRLKELAGLAGVALIDHEIITLLRHFPIDELGGTPKIDGATISEAVRSFTQQS